jgi:plasmid maintenance system antidote protein VapI
MARTEPSPTAPPGSVLLRQHIDAVGTTIPAFALAAGIDRTRVQRLVEGGGAKRVSVIMATRIERASGGAVPVSAWAVDDAEDVTLEHDATSAPDTAVA